MSSPVFLDVEFDFDAAHSVVEEGNLLPPIEESEIDEILIASGESAISRIHCSSKSPLAHLEESALALITQPPPVPPLKCSTVQRKNATGVSCARCRRKHVKCDGADPCSRCVASDVTCTRDVHTVPSRPAKLVRPAALVRAKPAPAKRATKPRPVRKAPVKKRVRFAPILKHYAPSPLPEEKGPRSPFLVDDSEEESEEEPYVVGTPVKQSLLGFESSETAIPTAILFSGTADDEAYAAFHAMLEGDLFPPVFENQCNLPHVQWGY